MASKPDTLIPRTKGAARGDAKSSVHGRINCLPYPTQDLFSAIPGNYGPPLAAKPRLILNAINLTRKCIEVNLLDERDEYVEEEKALKVHPERYQGGGPIYLVKEDSMSNNGIAFPTKGTSRDAFPPPITWRFGTEIEGFLREVDGDGDSSLWRKNGASSALDAQTIWEELTETVDNAENTRTVDSDLHKCQKAKRRFL